MSVENNVFMIRANMPTPEEWASAIRSRGFEMELDSDFDVEEFEGFLPCKYKGEEAGFEYWSEPTCLEELVEEGLLNEDEKSVLGESDFLVTLATHSDFRDLITSMIASAVLVELSGGYLAEGGEPPFVHGADAVQAVRKSLPAIEKEL